MPSIRLGYPVIDSRTGQRGTFNGWRLLRGQRHALAIAGPRRWWIPEAAIVKPVSPATIANKRRRAVGRLRSALAAFEEIR